MLEKKIKIATNKITNVSNKAVYMIASVTSRVDRGST